MDNYVVVKTKDLDLLKRTDEIPEELILSTDCEKAWNTLSKYYYFESWRLHQDIKKIKRFLNKSI